MYKISEFSLMTGLSRESLRYYAEIKLLEPVFINPNNGYRYYDEGSYLLAMLLVKLRGFGLSIQEMQSVMQDESFTHLEDLLLIKKQGIQEQIEDLLQKIKGIDEFLETGREK